MRVNCIRIVFARLANTLSSFNAESLLSPFFFTFSRKKRFKNTRNFYIHALRNVDILSVVYDSAGWFSLSFDDDDDGFVEDDEDDDFWED